MKPRNSPHVPHRKFTGEVCAECKSSMIIITNKKGKVLPEGKVRCLDCMKITKPKYENQVKQILINRSYKEKEQYKEKLNELLKAGN